jgi:hypothetical protein
MACNKELLVVPRAETESYVLASDYDALAARAATLLAEVAHYTSGTPHPDAADAARYRWLRDTPSIGIMRTGALRGRWEWSVQAQRVWHDSQSLDEAVDAARLAGVSNGSAE